MSPSGVKTAFLHSGAPCWFSVTSGYVQSQQALNRINMSQLCKNQAGEIVLARSGSCDLIFALVHGNILSFFFFLHVLLL